MPETSFSGDQVDVCVADDNACGVPAGPSGDGGLSTMCGTLVAPTVSAHCDSCGGTSTMTCAANGCYGGWWCNTASSKCEMAPTTCSPSGDDAGAPGPPPMIDAGGPLTSTIGPMGGTESRLFFAIMGDTRPANVDDTSTYPSAIGTKIYQDIDGVTPKPPFLVTTGDYMFASTTGGQAMPQMALYLQAQSNYTGTVFEAMGNHECTGATASNCGSGNTDGLTDNYNTFMAQMMTPLGNTNPYYQVNVAASDASWTAKFVFIAGNAWSDAQSTWLTSALSQTTTYTFIVRHEPAEANTAPGVTPSEAIMANYPYTLAITGHTHTYEKSGTKQVVIGNGGAPLTGSGDYGYALVTQLATGAIEVDMYDYSTNQPDTSFRFAVNPDGSAAP
jgi:predicted phosphodiesterase